MFFRRKKAPAPKDETVFADSLRSLQELFKEAESESVTAQPRTDRQSTRTRETNRTTAPSRPRPTPELRRAQAVQRSAGEAPPAPKPSPSAASATTDDDDIPVLTEIVYAKGTPIRPPLTPAAMASRIVERIAAEIGAPNALRWTPEIADRVTGQVRDMLTQWRLGRRSSAKRK